MSKRQKPIGDEWQRFRDEWYLQGHEGKVELARGYGVTYDTAKHWISEGDTSSNGKVKGIPVEPSNKVPEGEVLFQLPMEIQPAVHLDFVTFDLETTNLRADFSVVLSAVIKPYEQAPLVFRADDYPAWFDNRPDDSEIVSNIVKELSCHAIVVTHYGGGFDIPFLRAKAAKYGLSPLPPMWHLDTYRIARRNFLISSRRLQSLSNFFGLGEKSAVEGALWLQAALGGNQEAMDKIVDHNIQDCILLEKLAALSFPYLKSIPRL